jgi:hypothetical protein
MAEVVETYRGAEGWGGPVRVLIRDGRPVAATCDVCGDRWDLQVLAQTKSARVLGPLICPAGCDAPPSRPNAGDRAGTDPRI